MQTLLFQFLPVTGKNIVLLDEDTHGALVEWYRQGRSELYGEKPEI